MAYSRALSALIRDKVVGPRFVPIVSDETRTFGMEGMFRQVGMYQPLGQLYRPQDADQLMWYREDKTGQILQEGINEAGAVSSWMAAATSYSTHGKQMIPFFIFYSMFGFQRIGDFIWAAGDMRSRGFLMGGTAGRTTLNGEGLQHEDGQSHIMASFIPNCVVLRSDLRLRTCGDHARRPAPHDRRARRRVLLPHRDERELPPSGDAGRRGRRHHQGPLPARQGRGQERRAARAPARLGHDLARSRGRRGAAQGLRRRRRRVQRDEHERTAPRRPRRRTLEPPASRPRSRAHRGLPTCSTARTIRSSARPTT